MYIYIVLSLSLSLCVRILSTPPSCIHLMTRELGISALALEIQHEPCIYPPKGLGGCTPNDNSPTRTWLPGTSWLRTCVSGQQTHVLACFSSAFHIVSFKQLLFMSHIMNICLHDYQEPCDLGRVCPRIPFDNADLCPPNCASWLRTCPVHLILEKLVWK